MMSREWALVSFTILAQMSVGSFIILGLVHYLAMRKAGIEEADRLSDRALFAIGPVLVLGMFASLFHLGTPLGAYRAINHVNSSWLSREILFGVLFAGTGAVFALMQWRKIASFQVRAAVALVAAVFGIALVTSMSMVYLLPVQPSWDTFATPVTFFTTALLLGSLALGVAFVANYAFVQRKNPECEAAQCELLRSNLRWIAVASIVLLGVEFVVAPVYLGILGSTSQGAATVSMYVHTYSVAFLLRLVLAFVGAGVLAFFLYQNASSPGREKFLGSFAYSAFVLVFVSEVIARYLFYITHIRIGL